MASLTAHPNLRRLVKDVSNIIKSPLTEQGIYYSHSEDNLLEGHALIFGPEDTIYANGCYFFKFSYPTDYPFTPPKVTYLTNNGSTRFNPNLYRNGKVCISLLNTWKGEQWTSCQTISTILLTLTTLFHNKPLLNEPGISEQHKHFTQYNNIIEYENYKTAILKVLNKALLPNSSWYPIIEKHFSNKKLQKLILKNIKKNSENKDLEGKEMKCSIYTMKNKINYTDLYINFATRFDILNK